MVPKTIDISFVIWYHIVKNRAPTAVDSKARRKREHHMSTEIRLPRIAEAAPDQVDKVARIYQLTLSLTEALMDLTLTDNYKLSEDGSIELTASGVVTEAVLLMTEGLRKAIDDIDSSKCQQMAETMSQSTTKDLTIRSATGAGPSVTYEYTQPRAIRKFQFDRLRVEHPSTYERMEHDGYITQQTSDAYVMQRTVYEIPRVKRYD